MKVVELTDEEVQTLNCILKVEVTNLEEIISKETNERDLKSLKGELERVRSIKTKINN